MIKITGFVISSPKLTKASGGTMVCKFWFKTDDGDSYLCVAFNDFADPVSKFQVGMRLMVKGAVKDRRFVGREEQIYMKGWAHVGETFMAQGEGQDSTFRAL